MEKFQLEKEMKPIVLNWLQKMKYAIKEEVVTSEGIVDIVGCAITSQSASLRQSNNIKEHFSNNIQIVICLYLAKIKNEVEKDEIFKFMHKYFLINYEDFEKEIQKLISKNAICDIDNKLQMTKGWFPMQGKIISIELKLNNLKEAFNQAKRYSVFSNETYVAFPTDRAKKLSDSDLEMFIKDGIGILSVGNKVKVILGPKKVYPKKISYFVESFRIFELFWKDYSKTI